MMLPDFCRSICFTESGDTRESQRALWRIKFAKSFGRVVGKRFGIKTPALFIQDIDRQIAIRRLFTIWPRCLRRVPAPCTRSRPPQNIRDRRERSALVMFREFATTLYPAVQVTLDESRSFLANAPVTIAVSCICHLWAPFSVQLHEPFNGVWWQDLTFSLEGRE